MSDFEAYSLIFERQRALASYSLGWGGLLNLGPSATPASIRIPTSGVWMNVHIDLTPRLSKPIGTTCIRGMCWSSDLMDTQISRSLMKSNAGNDESGPIDSKWNRSWVTSPQHKWVYDDAPRVENGAKGMVEQTLFRLQKRPLRYQNGRPLMLSAIIFTTARRRFISITTGAKLAQIDSLLKITNLHHQWNRLLHW
jgi:hypothetical protein